MILQCGFLVLLTLMATSLHSLPTGLLIKLEVPLDAGEREVREIYLSPKLRDWLASTLPTLPSQWDLKNQSPEMQVDALTHIFVAGEPLAFDSQFNVLAPCEKGVWELKTPDVRIFGWFVEKDVFIGVVADDATFVKVHGLYSGYRDEVVRFRDQIELEYIEGDHPNDVVSDWNFSS